MPQPISAVGRGRTLRWPGSPPRSLLLLLAVVGVVGLSWALITPPWQTPDAVAHFAYEQSIAEGPTLPGIKGRPEVSDDQAVADAAVRASPGAFAPAAVPPNWSATDQRAYEAIEHGRHPPSRTDGGGANPAQGNAPVYYAFAAAGYLLDDGGTTFGRLYTTTIWQVLLVLATALGAWLLAGETFGRRRLPQLVTGAFAGLLPMDVFDMVAINPDALMIPLWTFALWLGARVINRRGQTRDAVWLCAVTAAAILTKPTSYALVPPLAFALAVGWRRAPAARRPAALRRLVASLGVLVAPVAAWFALSAAEHRMAITTVTAAPGTHAKPFVIPKFLAYVWQYYLPRLWFMGPVNPIGSQLHVYSTWISQDAGVFGWLEVSMPHWVYPVAGWTAAIVAALSVGALVRRRLSGIGQLFSFYLIALICLLGLLHVTEWRSILNNDGAILQGRYLLPAVGLFGLALGLIVSRVPRAARGAVAGFVLVALIGAQLLSLATVVHAFYL